MVTKINKRLKYLATDTIFFLMKHLIFSKNFNFLFIWKNKIQHFQEQITQNNFERMTRSSFADLHSFEYFQEYLRLRLMDGKILPQTLMAAVQREDVINGVASVLSRQLQCQLIQLITPFYNRPPRLTDRADVSINGGQTM